MLLPSYLAASFGGNTSHVIQQNALVGDTTSTLLFFNRTSSPSPCRTKSCRCELTPAAASALVPMDDLLPKVKFVKVGLEVEEGQLAWTFYVPARGAQMLTHR